jgi:hypothetical protein
MEYMCTAADDGFWYSVLAWSTVSGLAYCALTSKRIKFPKTSQVAK